MLASINIKLRLTTLIDGEIRSRTGRNRFGNCTVVNDREAQQREKKKHTVTEKKQSGASLGLQKRNSFITYLVHLLDHFCEFLVVLQNFVELSHRVGAELVEKTRHFFSCGRVFLLACALSSRRPDCDS